jgi:hypothetical protein
VTASVAELTIGATRVGMQAVAEAAPRAAQAVRRRAFDIRSLVLQVLGMAALCYAMFQWHQIAGFVAVGLSFFALEFITGDRRTEDDAQSEQGARPPGR